VFTYRDTHEGDLRVQVAFTDVHLDVHEDAPGRDQAIAALEQELGVTVARMHQVHGAEVAEVSAVDDPSTVDGLVTQRPGLALMTRAADCVPVLLADPIAGVVGAVHAGRKGVALGVVSHAVQKMRELGAKDITAWVGPHICGRCYEVPDDLRAEVAALVPETYAETSWGTPSLDLGAGVLAQLQAHSCQVIALDRCTLEDPALHSHRRDGAAAGRMAGLVWIEP
jgi:polyphenol oxidase